MYRPKLRHACAFRLNRFSSHCGTLRLQGRFVRPLRRSFVADAGTFQHRLFPFPYPASRRNEFIRCGARTATVILNGHARPLWTWGLLVVRPTVRAGA